jgi:hypothetical protein
VLLGGLITLAVTAFVQIAIIPWVQTRTRRRERWEKHVVELDALLRWELPEALSDAKTQGEQMRWRSASHEYAAAEQLPVLARRLRSLVNVVRLERRQSIYWYAFASRAAGAAEAVTEAAGTCSRSAGELNENEWETAWNTADYKVDYAAVTFALVSSPMTPPPVGRLQRWFFARRILRMRVRGVRTKEDIRRLSEP